RQRRFHAVLHVLHVAQHETGARRVLHRADADGRPRVPAAEPVRQHARHPARVPAARWTAGVRGAPPARGDARRELRHLQRLRTVRAARRRARVGGVLRLGKISVQEARLDAARSRGAGAVREPHPTRSSRAARRSHAAVPRRRQSRDHRLQQARRRRRRLRHRQPRSASHAARLRRSRHRRRRVRRPRPARRRRVHVASRTQLRPLRSGDPAGAHSVATDTPNLTLPADAVLPAPSAAQDDPLWYKDAIIYQAHVKSFFDSNNDGIGDFPGLTQKLDYLQSLGVTCVWLLPFFPSPLRDDGYDIADYENVHPSYGTLHDFEALVRAAHARNIKVLIELVVNHTSDQHPWFQRARRAPKGSPEREFYVWSDTDKKFAETRIIFLDTEKSNWAWDETAGQYYWHRFFSHQPDLNHNNPAVVDAVIGVMKFWLDRGVDALRLDAVPYLCVRDGTNNENLPETHAVLKRIRHELDAAYRNRLLLAEANQWPADVRPYFGDGDECHMAFHFPLMPRMFMALRQEDRHAITEILNQTPDIPETCQWALFLRNHDELTLEMVSDEERDYMYQMYAGDPQMRLNLGIRRRLAPLMENSRRRIELL